MFTPRHFISSLACFSIVGWGNVTSTANEISALLHSYCVWWTGLCKVGKKTLNKPRLGSCQLVKTMRLIKVDVRSGPRPPLVRTQCEGSVGVVTRWQPQRTAATKVTQVTTDKRTNKTQRPNKNYFLATVNQFVVSRTVLNGWNQGWTISWTHHRNYRYTWQRLCSAL